MRNKYSKIIIKISTLFGIGYLKRGNASVASIIGFILFFALNQLSFYLSIILFLLITLLSFPIIKKARYIIQKNDPHEIVLDEFIASALIPFFFQTFFLGFISLIFFRIIDLVKIFPINIIDKYNHWSMILFDDIASSLLAILIVILLTYIIQL